MRDRASIILRFVETAAILIGVAIAVYELYLSDRSEQRLDDIRAFEVSTSLLDYEPFRDFVTLMAVYVERRTRISTDPTDEESSKEIIRDINIKSYPILGRVSAIEKCIAADLCNEKIIQQMSCETIINIHRHLKTVSELYKYTSEIAREKPLSNMVKRCESWKDGT